MDARRHTRTGTKSITKYGPDPVLLSASRILSRGRRAGERLAADTTRLRAALAEAARTTAEVMTEHAAGLDCAAASYRRIAQTGAAPGSAYHLQRAALLEAHARPGPRLRRVRGSRGAAAGQAPFTADHLTLR